MSVDMHAYPSTNTRYSSSSSQNPPCKESTPDESKDPCTSYNYDEPNSSNSSNGWGLSTQSSRNPEDVATAVKALLVGTKQLQDILRKWSIGQGTEEAVSDVYVRIGTDFNTVVHAFTRLGIDMSDLQSVPKDLRSVLEQCLGEEPKPQTLSEYMPEVRQILYVLLEGLKARQPLWKAASGRA